MKKTSLILTILCVLALTGCGHEHTWKDADCINPKTCVECGATEGVALGHTWVDATCKAPKTCSVCKATEGTALEHTWKDADCINPKTCTVCNTTEGSALGHVWMDATYEAPMTCSVCGETEGEPLPAPEATDENVTMEELFKVIHPELYENTMVEMETLKQSMSNVYSNIEVDFKGNEMYYTYTFAEGLEFFYTTEALSASQDVLQEQGVKLIDTLEDDTGIRLDVIYFVYCYADGSIAYSYGAK